jgi:Ca2+-binding EF-hand superfamily protein
VFRRLDRDQDGALTRDEFLYRENRIMIFQALDANDNGTLTKYEWVGASNMFRVMDSTATAWCAATSSCAPIRAAGSFRGDGLRPQRPRLAIRVAGPAAVFDRSDRNRDGVVTFDELSREM